MNDGNEFLADFERNERLAAIYYAYHAVHRYLEEPFTSYMPEALFNISRFLMTETAQNNRPQGVSLLYPLLNELPHIMLLFQLLYLFLTPLLVLFYTVYLNRLGN